MKANALKKLLGDVGLALIRVNTRRPWDNLRARWRIDLPPHGECQHLFTSLAQVEAWLKAWTASRLAAEKTIADFRCLVLPAEPELSASIHDWVVLCRYEPPVERLLDNLSQTWHGSHASTPLVG